MLRRTIAAKLGRLTLSAGVAIVVVTEALFHSVCAVVELALMHLALPCHSGIDYGIGPLWVCELNNNRGRPLESGFLGQLFYVWDLCIWYHGILSAIICWMAAFWSLMLIELVGMPWTMTP